MYLPLLPLLSGYPGFQTYPGTLVFNEATPDGYQEDVNDTAFTISDSSAIIGSTIGPLVEIDPPWAMNYTPYLF